MNSFEELNNYSNTSLEFQDDRLANLTFDPEPTHQTVTVYENLGFVSPVSTSITSFVSQSSPVTYTLDVSPLPGTTVTWESLPAHLTVTGNVTHKTVSGIKSAADWELVKSPTIEMPANPSNWYYTSTIKYNGDTATKSWYTTVSVIQLDQFSQPSEFFYPNDSQSIIQSTPQLSELGLPGSAPATYTVVLTPLDIAAITTLGSSGGGVNGVFDPGLKTLTITGTFSQVNANLHNILLTPVSETEITWLARYSVYNPLTNFTSTVLQAMKSLEIAYMDRPTDTYFNKNIVSVISGVPTIVDVISNPLGTFTLEVSSLEVGAITTLSSTGSGGTSSFNGTTKILTITGTKAQVNSHLPNITLTPGLDYAADMHIKYHLVTPLGVIVSRVQNNYVSALNTFMTNLNVSREFVSNTPDQTLFPTLVPQITETVASAVYTIYLSSSAGKFGTSQANVTSTYSLIGSKAEVNAVLGTIKFYPHRNTTGYQTFTFTQNRNGTFQVDSNIGLIGSDRQTAIPGLGTFNFTTSQTASFTYEQANYLLADITLVGGGGGGGGASFGGTSSTSTCGGGGGGGQVRLLTNQTIGRLTSPIIVATIASGGAAGSQPTAAPSGTNGGVSSITIGQTVTTAIGGYGGQGGASRPYSNSTFTFAVGGHSGTGWPGGTVYTAVDGAGGGSAPGSGGGGADGAGGPSSANTGGPGQYGFCEGGLGGSSLNSTSNPLTPPVNSGNGGVGGRTGYIIGTSTYVSRVGGNGAAGKVVITFHT